MNMASLKPAVPRFARSAVALAMAAACASAFAVSEFTLDPSAIGLNATSTITADNIVISDFSTVRLNGGTFKDEGFLSVSAFQLGGTTLGIDGLNEIDGYGFYFKFMGEGTTSLGDPSEVATSGTFTKLTYELYGFNGPASFGFDGDNKPTESASGEVLLATGQLIPGTGIVGTAVVPGVGFIPFAAAKLTFVVDPGAADFFVMPASFYDLASTVFINDTDKVRGIDGGFRIENGGGTVSFDMAPAIPEPETYALMLAGLAAVGFVARRRRRQD